MIEAAHKVCFKCQQRLPVESFYRHPMTADGRLGKCKGCTKRDVAKNYYDRHQQYRDYDKRRNHTPERRAAIHRYQRERRRRNPEKAWARQVTRRAVAKGILTRLPCQVCGDLFTEAHHHDYSKPLDVRWLCFICHRKEHGQLKTF
jgi:hypothetical protein